MMDIEKTLTIKTIKKMGENNYECYSCHAVWEQSWFMPIVCPLCKCQGHPLYLDEVDTTKMEDITF